MSDTEMLTWLREHDLDPNTIPLDGLTVDGDVLVVQTWVRDGEGRPVTVGPEIARRTQRVTMLRPPPHDLPNAALTTPTYDELSRIAREACGDNADLAPLMLDAYLRAGTISRHDRDETDEHDDQWLSEWITRRYGPEVRWQQLIQCILRDSIRSGRP